MALGELEDPFYRLNEIDFHKLEDEEWIYRKEFNWDGQVAEQGKIYLVLEGIDTLADIYMNGHYLGRAENMFIPYRFEVKDLLRAGLNQLEVHFDSPVRTVRALEVNSPVKLHGSAEVGRPYVRKAQYSYGWDWGPRIAQVGLWKSVYLEVIDAAKIHYPSFETRSIDKDGARVYICAEVEAIIDDDMEAFVEVFYENKAVISEKARLENSCINIKFNC